jgi:hypothetical protein
MPTDFFWQFDQWSQDRACSTLQKVIGRIFAAIMTRQREGVLEVVAVDQQSGMIQVSFESCAECHGLNASKPMCFYHAGLFAGLLSSMLDRDLDAFETDCGGVQGKVCTFTIGGSDGALVSRSLGEWLASGAGRIGQPAGSETDSPGQGRGLGSLVDIGYYQMLIASSLLANADVVQRACFDAGVDVGSAVAADVAARFGTETGAALAGYYRDTRYIDLKLNRVEEGLILEAREVPEAVGPLSTTSLTAFLCGELQALVGRLEGRELRYDGSEMKGGTLLVRLVPKLLEA